MATTLNPGLARIAAGIFEEAAATHQGTRYTYDEAVTLLIADRIERGILSNGEAQTLADWRSERGHGPTPTGTWREIEQQLLDEQAEQEGEERPTSELEQRQTDWTNGHDIGVEKGLRVAFELVSAQQDATNLELQKLIDAVDPGKSGEGFAQRVALRGRSEGLREAWELIGTELRRRRSLRRAPGSSKGEALTKI